MLASQACLGQWALDKAAASSKGRRHSSSSSQSRMIFAEDDDRWDLAIANKRTERGKGTRGRRGGRGGRRGGARRFRCHYAFGEKGGCFPSILGHKPSIMV